MREIIVLVALIAVSFLSVTRAELRVTQVQVLFRHGDRMPILEEIDDGIASFSASAYEKLQLGQLTNIGKMREYRLGQVLRTRYQEFLGSLYIPSAVYAYSTNTDRTKASLQLVLAALFPPSESQMWNPELPWLPIPIHYTPTELDSLMYPQLCPQYENAYDEITKLPEVQAKIAVYDDLFNFVGAKPGPSSKKLYQLFITYNRLDIERSLNFSRPEWYSDAIHWRMGESMGLQSDLWSYTTDAKRLYGGPMVRRFIENMHLNRTRENPRKLYLYSAHDKNIVAFLRAQGILEPRLSDFGSAVMIEKIVDEDGRFYVRLIMWTGVTEKLITLQLPGCETVCPIEKYLQLTREIIPSDEELDCHWKRHSALELRRAFD